MLRRLLVAAAGIAALVPVGASACGGLVAPNGAVRLARAATLVAWHDGIEHYMTSFSYQGDISGLGWIVPLPAVPDTIEQGGNWTLQRLLRESEPVRFAANSGASSAGLAPAAAPAEVLEQTQVEALDITVIRGDGQGVAEWCAQNGFTLPAETRAHILAYARTTPVFMAAKYDVRRAQLSGRFVGDGTPLLITMHTPHLWVPLEVLANADDQVNADLYLLTDSWLSTAGGGAAHVGDELPGAPGFTITFQEPMNAALHRDLSTDKNMSWVPADAYFTALHLDAVGHTVTYDMSVTQTGEMRLASMGAGPAAATQPPDPAFLTPPGLPRDDGTQRTMVIALFTAGSILGAVLVGMLAVAAIGRRRLTPRR